MSEVERTGVRDLTYSNWHRTKSLSRFVGLREASMCAAIDVDFCEYCRRCRLPLALIETQRSTNPPKPAPVMTALARLAGLDAWSVSYEANEFDDITHFRVRRLAPELTPVFEMAPGEWAVLMTELRARHGCPASLEAS